LRGLTEVRLEHRLGAVIADLDVLYVTRLQKERMKGTEQTSGLQGYPLERQYLVNARPGLLILHPLPRSGEIAYDVDEDFRAWYFEQAANGVLTRMALLDRLLMQAPALPLGALTGGAGLMPPARLIVAVSWYLAGIEWQVTNWPPQSAQPKNSSVVGQSALAYSLAYSGRRSSGKARATTAAVRPPRSLHCR